MAVSWRLPFVSLFARLDPAAGPAERARKRNKRARKRLEKNTGHRRVNGCHLRVKRCNLIGAEGKTRVSVSNRRAVRSFPLRPVYPIHAVAVRGSVSLQKHRDRVKSMGSANYLRRENFVNLIPRTSTNSLARWITTSYLGSTSFSVEPTFTVSEPILSETNPHSYYIHSIGQKEQIWTDRSKSSGVDKTIRIVQRLSSRILDNPGSFSLCHETERKKEREREIVSFTFALFRERFPEPIDFERSDLIVAD